MPTILDLVRRGDLVKIDPDLDEDEFELRMMYFVRGGDVRCDELLAKMQSQWNIEVSPIEQFDELVYNFATGGMLECPRQFHVLCHKRDGVWELKAPDLRLFGFFPMKDIFVCTDVADANQVKAAGQYSGYCEQCWFKRDRLDLDDPKFITGTDPRDVVSNCHSEEP